MPSDETVYLNGGSKTDHKGFPSIPGHGQESIGRLIMLRNMADNNDKRFLNFYKYGMKVLNPA